MRTTFLLPLLALATANDRIARHDHDGDEHGGDVMDMTASSAASPPGLPSGVSHPSSALTLSSTPATHAHAHGHPPGHHHNSHAPVKEFLDDVALHEWHDFPPTYLDADFRLKNDSLIFGEVFPDDWDPETVASHPALMGLHVGCMMVAYFVLLPVGESRADGLMWTRSGMRTSGLPGLSSLPPRHTRGC